jgi:hypothetical protein
MQQRVIAPAGHVPVRAVTSLKCLDLGRIGFTFWCLEQPIWLLNSNDCHRSVPHGILMEQSPRAFAGSQALTIDLS